MPPFHTHAAILSIGDELIRGQTLDTNSRLLSDRLLNLGIVPVEHITVGDDRAHIAAAIARLARLVPLILITGGLGPTEDDLTRDALADVLGEPLTEDPEALAALAARLARRGLELTTAQRLQALRPISAQSIPNRNGTAPGLWATVKTPSSAPSAPSPLGPSQSRGIALLGDVLAPGTPGGSPVPPPHGAAHASAEVACLPGPPGELVPMFDNLIVPLLRSEPGVTTHRRFIGVVGLPESQAAGLVPGLMSRDANPLVGITASGGILTWRILYRGRGGRGAAEADAAIEAVARRIHDAMSGSIFADSALLSSTPRHAALARALPEGGTRALAAAVIERLVEHSHTLTVVESCTGGLLGENITDIPGASSVFQGGWITYSNELKTRLVGVDSEILAQNGAVSPQTAAAMAEGGLQRSGATHALAVTGIAGPEGGSDEKPVGTVYIAHAAGPLPRTPDHAIATPTRTEVRRFHFPGSRADIRHRAAMSALAMLFFALNAPTAPRPPLLWQIGP